MGRRGLAAMRRALRQHVVVLPHHHHLWHTLGG
jgi:hypothetical protein